VCRLGVKGTTVVALAAQGRTVWASGWESIVKLSPSGRVALASVPGAIAPAADGVWVAPHNPGALSTIC